MHQAGENLGFRLTPESFSSRRSWNNRPRRSRANIRNDNTEKPSISQEEQQARHPQARDEGTVAQELKLEALLEPEDLSCYPRDGSRNPEFLVRQKGRSRQVEGKEDHVPEEVLILVYG